MALKCDEPVQLSFTNNCIEGSGIARQCSDILIGPGSIDVSIVGSGAGKDFNVIAINKQTREVSVTYSIRVENFSSYSFDFDNYDYQLQNIYINKFYYTQCYEKSEMENITSSLQSGSTSFFDSVSVIIPFIIIMIGFALGFNLLKNLISKSSKGRV